MCLHGVCALYVRRGHVDDHVLHVHVYIVPTMLTELLYPLQDGCTPLHYAAKGGHTCVEYLLSTPGIDVNIKNEVSWSHHHEMMYKLASPISSPLFIIAINSLIYIIGTVSSKNRACGVIILSL